MNSLDDNEAARQTWFDKSGLSRVAGKRDPSRLAVSRILEMLAFALLVPILGLVLFPNNPTGLASGFPWVAAAPLIFTVRYGCLWGVGCAATMAVFINLPLPAYAEFSQTHIVLGLATLALCLVIGDLASSSIKRNASTASENLYLRHRLESFSTDYHVLKVSHGMLEEHMAGQRLSLREALQSLKPLLTERRLDQAGSEVLALYSQFCSVQAAALYLVNDKGRLDTSAVATHGTMAELSPFDPVLRMAVQDKEMVNIRHAALQDKQHLHGLIAAVPLVDSEGTLHGVLAIKDMHFMSFQSRNLNVMALLGAFIGNLLSRHLQLAESPSDAFMTELRTSLHYAREHYTQSVILSLQFEPSDQGLAVAKYTCDSLRSLDSSWLCHNGNNSPVVCLLLPLLSVESAESYLQRLDEAVRDEFDVELPHVLQDSQIRAVTAKDTLKSCKGFFSVHLGSEVLREIAIKRGVGGAA